MAVVIRKFILCIHKSQGETFQVAYPVGLVVENHKVSATHIEPGKVVTCILGIKDVLVDDIGGPLCVGIGSSARQRDKEMEINSLIL